MNVAGFNSDLRILEREYNVYDRFGRLLRRNVNWKPNGYGTYTIYIQGVTLPDNANMRKTNVKIEVPHNVYDPAPGGRRYFYANIWIDPRVKIRHPRGRGWGQLPRLHQRDPDGFSYLCIHPDTVGGNENILHFIATLKIFIKNADPDVW